MPRTDFLIGTDTLGPTTQEASSGQPGSGWGLPIVTVLGYGSIVPTERTDALFRTPVPKMCPSSWLIEIGRRLGVPDEQLVLVPSAVDHNQFRITDPVNERPPTVAMLWSSLRSKRSELALKSLERLRERLPDLQAIFFGIDRFGPPPAEWLTYHRGLFGSDLATEVYNKARVFLTASVSEGLGMTSLEAMSCGAAVLTVDNGGSSDYARHEETALVVPPDDIDAIVGQLERLLARPELAQRLALAGARESGNFRWDRSARLLEAFLVRYQAEPDSYTAPIA